MYTKGLGEGAMVKLRVALWNCYHSLKPSCEAAPPSLKPSSWALLAQSV